MDQPTATSAILFEAVIVPHRSLSPRGLRILIGVICLLSRSDDAALLADRRLAGGRLQRDRGWPRGVPAAAECAARRASEMLLLAEDALRIVRTDQHGRRQERRLPVGWLNAVLEEPPGKVPKLLLVAHGLREEIAATLGEEEKRDLWSALRHCPLSATQPQFRQPAVADAGRRCRQA